MERTVLIRYGEISLKSERVRKKFENILIENIKSALKDTQYQIQRERGRIFLETKKPEKVAKRISQLPGVVSTSPTWQTKANMEKIRNLARDIIEKSFPETGTFAIRARRAGKHSFTSEDIEEKLGSDALEIKPDLTVNLDSPNNTLHVEIRKRKAYLFTKIIPGTGGLPVGSQEKVIVPFINELSDSAASTYLLLKRGSSAYPLFYLSDGATLKPNRKTIDSLKKYHPDLKFCSIQVQTLLDKLEKRIPEKYEPLILKRVFYRLAENVADKIGAKALISNENLEEMKEKTLKTVQLLEEKTTLPILHPLTGFNKKERKEIERRINPEISKRADKKSAAQNLSKKVKLEKILKLEEKILKKSSVKPILKTLEVHKTEG